MRNENLVHFHFSFLLKIKTNFSTHFSTFIFNFFVKNENEDCAVSFFKFLKKKNENKNVTNSFFSFQKK